MLYRPSLFYCSRLLHLVSHSQGTIVLILSGPMPSQGQGSRKLRVFGSQLHSWCSGTSDPEHCSWERWNVQRHQQPAPCPHTHGQRQQHLVSYRQSLCTLTRFVQAHHHNWFGQPELPMWDASTPSLAPSDREGHDVKKWKDLVLAMEVAKTSEIQVWGKPWLL